MRTPGGGETGRTLVAMLHGAGVGPAALADIVATVREAVPGADLFTPRLPYAGVLSFASPSHITAQLVHDMDAICGTGDRYATIILVGHSVGGLVARRLFLVAAGMGQTVPSDGALAGLAERPWASLVTRIVTLAALNRGWARSGRLGWRVSLASALLAFAGHISKKATTPTLFQVRRGAPFVVHTRLQWMALVARPQRTAPIVVQLLGTQDDLVAPDDAIDFTAQASGAGYHYVELPHTMHKDARIFGPSRDDPSGAAGGERKRRFTLAMTGDAAALAGIETRRGYLLDSLPPEADPSVKHVAFVIHGIRDDGYWTRKIAQRIREAATDTPEDATWRTVTSSYGYFAMLPFVLPWIRREKVEWLMDEYVRVKAAYPAAQFSYVGHSNGTYLLTSALQDYPAVRFRHVLFAGSVVPRDYAWRTLLDAGRVQKVVNMVATADWVVALVPTGLEPLRRLLDLGGAGCGGFRTPDGPDFHQVRYVSGTHSAGLAETQWGIIARFIVAGTPPPGGYAPTQAPTEVWVARWSSALLIAALGVVLIFVPIAVTWRSGFDSISGAIVSTALLAAYVAALKYVITRL